MNRMHTARASSARTGSSTCHAPPLFSSRTPASVSCPPSSLVILIVLVPVLVLIFLLKLYRSCPYASGLQVGLRYKNYYFKNSTHCPLFNLLKSGRPAIGHFLKAAVGKRMADAIREAGRGVRAPTAARFLKALDDRDGGSCKLDVRQGGRGSTPWFDPLPRPLFKYSDSP
jgi:hypothetical protein